MQPEMCDVAVKCVKSVPAYMAERLNDAMKVSTAHTEHSSTCCHFTWWDEKI